MTDEPVSRRTLLRSVGASAGVTTLAGQAAGDRQNRGGEYIVGIRPNGRGADVRAAASDVHRSLEFGEIGTALAGRFPEQALAGLENNPNVRYVEPDVRLQAAETTTVSSQSTQQTPDGVERIAADVAHDAGVTGDGVDVAVLDTGIDSTHETLVDNLGEGISLVDCTSDCDSWWADGNENRCLEDWDDDDDHGTHVAGTIGAADDGTGVVGVAPDATVHAVKVLDCAGDGRLSTVADGLTAVVDRGWDVANLSLGGTTGNEALRDACRYAASNGVVVVTAAGSTGPCTDCVHYPAAYDPTIAVTAVDGTDALVSTTCTGPEVDIAAPGSDVRSTVPDTDGYEYDDGSSMASPHVAGAAALLLADGYAPETVRRRLLESAVDVGLPETEQGRGRLDVARALALDGSEDGTGDDADSGDADDGDDGSSDTDDGSDESSDDAAPAIERFAVTDRSNSQWSRCDVEWTVSSPDSDLESVRLELRDGSRAVDSTETTVAGATDSGTNSLRVRGSAATVALTVVDRSGGETTETRGL